MPQERDKTLRIGDRVMVYTVPAVVTDYTAFTQARVQVRFCYGGKPRWFPRSDVIRTNPVYGA